MGKLYFVRVSDGTLLKTMTTGWARRNAVGARAHPSAYTKDFHNQLAEQIYAGDLLGNLLALRPVGSQPSPCGR